MLGGGWGWRGCGAEGPAYCVGGWVVGGPRLATVSVRSIGIHTGVYRRYISTHRLIHHDLGDTSGQNGQTYRGKTLPGSHQPPRSAHPLCQPPRQPRPAALPRLQRLLAVQPQPQWDSGRNGDTDPRRKNAKKTRVGGRFCEPPKTGQVGPEGSGRSMPARQRCRRPPPGARDLSAAQNVRRPPALPAQRVEL